MASASLPWQGIFLQARRFNATGTVGHWDEPVKSSNTRLMRSDNEADTITHRNIAPKSSLEFLWNPPKRNEGPIIFTCDEIFFFKLCSDRVKVKAKAKIFVDVCHFFFDFFWLFFDHFHFCSLSLGVNRPL